jgi:hypothetical protein
MADASNFRKKLGVTGWKPPAFAPALTFPSRAAQFAANDAGVAVLAVILLDVDGYMDQSRPVRDG